MTRPCGLVAWGNYWCNLAGGHIGECRRAGLRKATREEVLDYAHNRDLVTIRERPGLYAKEPEVKPLGPS